MIKREVLDVVEAWARAKRWLRYDRARNYHHDLDAGWPWMLDVSGDSVRIHRGSAKPVDIDGRGVDVSPHAAIVWALVIEAKLPPVDVGRCNRCLGAGRLWEDGSGDDFMGTAPKCPDCSGTGRERREVARLLLDAQPKPRGNHHAYRWTEPGNPASIEALHVLADRLQEPVCSACARSQSASVACFRCGKLLVPSPHAEIGLCIALLLCGSDDALVELAEIGVPLLSASSKGDQ